MARPEYMYSTWKATSKTTLCIYIMLLKIWDLFITVCGFGSGLVFHSQIAKLFLFQIRTNWCKKDLAICMRHVFIVSIRSPGPWYLECCVLKLRRLLKLFLSPTHILISSTFNNILLLIIKSLLLQVEICWVLFGVAVTWLDLIKLSNDIVLCTTM